MTSQRTVDRIKRILALVPYVLERETVDVAEVMERFGYTHDELTRDLNSVFVCGLPGYSPSDLMEAYIEGDEVIIDAAEFFSRAPRFTPTEALGLLAAGLAVLGMGEEIPALESAVRKLGAAVMPDAADVLSVDVPESATVRGLRQAVASNQPVQITYRSVGKEETTVRVIEPWVVFHTIGQWYVTGHCRLVGGERTFRVDRIRDLEPLEGEFQPPASPPEPGVGYTPTEGDISCVIELGPGSEWVRDYYPVEDVREDGPTRTIRFSSPDPELAARLLLRLGDSAKLVEGPEVADRLGRLGRSLLERYS
jgi:predicted DNA-binding transcriptional regulator YafY